MSIQDTKNKVGKTPKGQRKAVIIAGPTASGKSAMALDIAEHFLGTVINADSQQVYKELREITARPSVADENKVPHRLFGVLSGAEKCSAGRWCAMAVDEIEACFERGHLPVVVGGTGMYLKSLVEGLSPIPDIDPAVRQAAINLHAHRGGVAFKDCVAKLDPASAERLPVGDTQRLIRAWEVATATGRPLSEWQDEPRVALLADVHFAHIALMPERDALYGGIERRFDQMVETGALDEVRALMDLSLAPDLPVMKALGVPELMAYLRGDIDLETAVRDAKKVSRNYAKRQLTWVRSQMADAYIVHAQYSKSFQEKIFSFIHRFLLTDET